MWGGIDAKDAANAEAICSSLTEVREAGYASAIGTTEAKFSAIAIPVIQKGAVVGAVNIIFFRSALRPREAAERYLQPLRTAVERIVADPVAPRRRDHRAPEREAGQR